MSRCLVQNGSEPRQDTGLRLVVFMMRPQVLCFHVPLLSRQVRLCFVVIVFLARDLLGFMGLVRRRYEANFGFIGLVGRRYEALFGFMDLRKLKIHAANFGFIGLVGRKYTLFFGFIP